MEKIFLKWSDQNEVCTPMWTEMDLIHGLFFTVTTNWRLTAVNRYLTGFLPSHGQMSFEIFRHGQKKIRKKLSWSMVRVYPYFENCGHEHKHGQSIFFKIVTLLRTRTCPWPEFGGQRRLRKALSCLASMERVCHGFKFVTRSWKWHRWHRTTVARSWQWHRCHTKLWQTRGTRAHRTLSWRLKLNGHDFYRIDK